MDRILGLKFVELKKHVLGGKLAPAYLISGDDAFIVRSAVGFFRALTGEFPELNFTAFRSDASPTDIVNALNSPPVLSDKRAVTVADFAGDAEPIKKYLESPNPTSVLIFTGSLTRNINPIVKSLETVDCNRLDMSYLTGWITGKTASEGGSITPEAARKLAEYCNREMNRINAELNKLVCFAAGEEITESTVENLVSPDEEYKIYELSEAIATKNNEKAMNILTKLFAENNAPVALTGMLFNHFRRLLFASLNPTSPTLAADLRITDYAAKMAVKQSAAFSPRRLLAIVNALGDLDYLMKTSGASDKTSLTAFVCGTLIGG